MSTRAPLVPLVWVAGFWEMSGYADEARGLALALDQAGVPLHLVNGRPEVPGVRDGLPAEQRQRLIRREARVLPREFIQVQHITLDGVAPFHEQAVYRVARTMFETDSLPSSWVAAANTLDELWVPSAFNVDTFRRAGVRVPIHVVPGGIDTAAFTPDAPPRAIEGARGTVFLGVFEWRWRKGWDVLLRAWANAFGPDDDVSLVLRSYPAGKGAGRSNREVLDAEIHTFLQQACGRRREEVAPIVVLGEPVPATALPSLYTAADAFVLATRGEGWGRPFMEAMACGVPVITTRWSAHLDFLTDENALLVDIEGLEPARAEDMPLYRHQQWARPSVAHLSARLRQAHHDRAALRALGQRGRDAMVRDWAWSKPAAVVADRVAAISAALATEARDLRVQPTAPADVQVHGGHTDAQRPTAAVEPWVDAALSADLDVRWEPWTRTVRPPLSAPARRAARRSAGDSRPAAINLLAPATDEQLTVPALALPGHGAVVVDAAALVRDGVEPTTLPFLRDVADVVCVPDPTSRDTLTALGLSPARVIVTPPAADPSRFTPHGAAYLRGHTAALRLLAFGGAHPNRGLPRLLGAYDRAFGAADDVALHLVLQPPTVGEDLAWRERLIGEATAGTRPAHLPRLWIDVADRHWEEMPAVYRAAHVYVHAGRALTHGRTVAEALACGRPVIVTDSPLARTLVDASRGWLIPPGPGGFADVTALARALREASDPGRRAAMSEAARAWAVARYANDRADHPRAARQQALHAARTCATAGTARRGGHAVPTHTAAFPLDQPRRVVVLARAAWHDGTMERLITTHARACAASADVSLVVLLDPAQGVSVEQAAERVAAAVAAAGASQAGASPAGAAPAGASPAGAADGPDVLLVPDLVTEPMLAALHASVHAVAVGGAGAWAETVAADAARAGRVVLSAGDPAAWRHALEQLLAP